jgi:hypothetical protein
MKKSFLLFVSCFFALVIGAKEFQLNDKEDVFSFGDGLIGIHFDRKTDPSFTLRKINFQCEEVKMIKVVLGEGKWSCNYENAGSRLVIETYNVKLGISDIYFYDTTLTLISKKSLTKEQVKGRYTRTGSTERKFDMADYYNRQLLMLSNALTPCDKFVEDGLLFLKCDESLMRTVPGGFTNAGKVFDKDASAIIYRLKWGNNEGSFPINFDIKWSVKLPFQSVLGYRFYDYGKKATFLYLVSNDGDEMRSYYYRLDPETGEIIQKVEVKLANGAIAWASSFYYDENTDDFFVVGNYQSEKRTKDTFDGYFIGKINKDEKANYVMKAFPAIADEEMPGYWKKNPMMVASHFTKALSGKYTAICALYYSFEDGGGRNAQGESVGAGKVFIVAAAILLDFDNSLSQVEPRTFMFQHYDKNARKTGYYNNSTFQVMNGFSMLQSGFNAITSDISATGITEMIWFNSLEEYNTLMQEATYGYYVLSTAPGSELKKLFDVKENSGEESQSQGYYKGAPGEVIWHFQSKEKGDYLQVVKTHL